MHKINILLKIQVLGDFVVTKYVSWEFKNGIITHSS